MELIKVSVDNLRNLANVVEQIGSEGISKRMVALGGSTIGENVRHILEYYLCLLDFMDTGVINYGDRKRDGDLEIDHAFISDTINFIIDNLKEIESSHNLALRADFSLDSTDAMTLKTNVYRELGYCYDHAVHHMTLLRLAIANKFKDVKLPETFGKDVSTLQYLNKLRCV